MDITAINPLELKILGYVALSMLLGAVIGIDRELAKKPSGLRTNMLVAGSSTLLVSLGEIIVVQYNVDNEVLRTDPIRIIEAVITGISFIGAGIIIKQGVRDIKGLTTATSILFVASMGICVALSKIVLAVGVTLIAVLTLSGLGYIERRLHIKPKNNSDT